MFKALAYVHALLFRLCFWLLRLPVRAVWAMLLTLVALLGEEFRRWAGLLTVGLVLFLAGKATINYAPPSMKKELAIVVLVMLLIWALAVMRSARYTMHNNFRAVRARQTFKKLDERTAQIPDQAKAIKNATVKKTRGTPVELVFPANRSARREERAAAEQAAEQAATAQRRSQTAAEDDDRHREYLASLEPDPFQ